MLFQVVPVVPYHLSGLGIVMPILQLGLPDRFIDHGNREKILQAIGLDTDGIYRLFNSAWNCFSNANQKAL